MTIESLLDRNEIRRLEKAAREKNKIHLACWAQQFEKQIQKEYEKKFQAELEEAITHYWLAMIYTLHFSEETKLGKKRIDRFRNDAMAVVDGFKNGEFKPEDYEKKLKEAGIF